jgi:hypothetical protein
MPAFKDTLLEHAYTCICYCLESRRQTARLAQLDAFMRGGAGSSPEERWAGLHQLIQEELQAMSPSECSTLIRMLPLLLQEQMVKAIPPPNTHLLSSLIQSLSDEHGTSSSAHFEITLWLLNVFATCKWTEPVTPVQLLKLLGRPSRIPKLEGTIFQCTLAIINAVKAVLLGSTDPVTIAIDLDALCPAIGQMILARLIDNLPRRAQRIADVVKDQTGLYLDLTRPFLLFKIDPRGYTIIAHYLCTTYLAQGKGWRGSDLHAEMGLQARQSPDSPLDVQPRHLIPGRAALGSPAPTGLPGDQGRQEKVQL